MRREGLLIALTACAPPATGADTGTAETGADASSTSTGEDSETRSGATEAETETETGDEEPSGPSDTCTEDPKIADYIVRWDGNEGTAVVDIEDTCIVADITGADLSGGQTVDLDCLGGLHTIEVIVDVEGAPTGLPLAVDQEVSLRIWGTESWFRSLNLFVRDTEGAVLLAHYQGQWLPDEVPENFEEDYAPDEVSEGLYLWIDEDFTCPLECPTDLPFGSCVCHEELALGIRFPSFAEAIIESESAGPVPRDPPGFAAVNQAQYYAVPQDCSVSDVPEGWFDILVLG